jgi:hypothetical protein
MAEGAAQIDCLFMMDMIEKNGLVDRGPRKNRKDGEEDTFCLDPKSMVGNDRKEEKEDNNDENSNCLFHISFFSLTLPLSPLRLCRNMKKRPFGKGEGRSGRKDLERQPLTVLIQGWQPYGNIRF